MKYTYFLLFLIGIIMIASTCSKSYDSSDKKEVNLKNSAVHLAIRDSDLIGNWLNLTDISDTLHIHDSIINRWDPDSKCVCQGYLFHLSLDTITLVYQGVKRIFILPYHNKIFLNAFRDTLTIINFQFVYPDYKGDVFRKLN